MKLKNRSNLFLVAREFENEECPIAGFLTLESADAYAASCQQDYEDREVDGFLFKVVPLIYYDM